MEEILNAGLQVDKHMATGAKRPATPNKKYDGAVVSEIEPAALFDDDKKNGWDYAANLYFEHKDIPDQDKRLIRKRIKWRVGANPHPKSAFFKMMSACWPEEADRLNKNLPADFVGCKVDVRTVAATTENGQAYTAIEVNAA